MDMLFQVRSLVMHTPRYGLSVSYSIVFSRV